MKLSLALAVISAAFLIVSLVSADQDENSSSTEAVKRDTYFGVDANDAEAVKQKQDELNEEKWQLLFGDLDADQLDFTPEFEKNPVKGVKESLKGFKELLHGILNKILRKKPSPTTTETTPL